MTLDRRKPKNAFPAQKRPLKGSDLSSQSGEEHHFFEPKRRPILLCHSTPPPAFTLPFFGPSNHASPFLLHNFSDSTSAAKSIKQNFQLPSA